MIGFDPLYLLLIAPAFALSLWASLRTKSAFKKYSQVRVATGLTGGQAAQRMLEAAGVRDVKIVPHQGMLSDHYNPVTKKPDRVGIKVLADGRKVRYFKSNGEVIDT